MNNDYFRFFKYNLLNTILSFVVAYIIIAFVNCFIHIIDWGEYWMFIIWSFVMNLAPVYLFICLLMFAIDRIRVFNLAAQLLLTLLVILIIVFLVSLLDCGGRFIDRTLFNCFVLTLKEGIFYLIIFLVAVIIHFVRSRFIRI